MNGVAAGAWRQLRRSSAHPVNRGGRDWAMALVAQRVDVRHVQQPGILRAMRRVASHAALRLHRSMLIHKRPARLGVALGADRILIGRGLQVVVPERAVRIVAVRCNSPAPSFTLWWNGISNCGFMSLWHWKQRVGCEAFSKLLLLSALLCTLWQLDAAHVGLGMRRTLEVGMRSRVAGQTRGIHVSWPKPWQD